MVKCSNCGTELKQLKGKHKIAVQINHNPKEQENTAKVRPQTRKPKAETAPADTKQKQNKTETEE